MNVKERTAEILKLLLKENNSFKTVTEVAENLGVSAKTVSRELPQAEKILAEYGLVLTKKKGAGLSIGGDEQALKKLRDKLGGVSGKSFSPQERRSIIISQLLPSKEPVKLFTLSSQLGVTDSTISNDLDKLEGWFKVHGLELIRKPGLGVYIAGDEKSIRQTIVEYIYDHIEESELLKLVHANLSAEQGNVNIAAGYLLDLVDKEIIHRLEMLIRKAEKELQTKLSDQSFIGLVVHLALAVQRIRKQERIHIRADFLQELTKKPEFVTAKKLGAAIAKEFAIQVSTDEIGYITMHLLGARSRYGEKDIAGTVMDNFHLVRLAKSIMKLAEEETGQKLYRNSELLTGLVNHLGPSISRLQMKMDIRNPLLEEMQENYPELMSIAKKSVRDVEKELELIFPPSEVAYIAMHLSAAIMDGSMLKRLEHKVIVACPTGMGTSRLLASRIKQQYDNLIITEQVSALELTPAYFAAMQVDFVISTVPIPKLPIPVVVVSALLTAADQAAIDAKILACDTKDVSKETKTPAVKLDFTAALKVMAAYNTAILSLIENFFFIEDEKAMTVKEAADLVGQRTGLDKKQSAEISRALLAREDKGSTAIIGSGMILLHCRSQAVTKLQFGIIHLGSYFLYPAEPTEKIRTAVVMLAPADSSCYELETIGYISSILLDRWGLIEILNEGSHELIKEELIRIFREFYAQKYKELMEGQT